MIHVKVNGEDARITAILYMRVAIKKIAYGAKVIWDTISGCFSSGRWVSKNPWIGSETWKNN